MGDETFTRLLSDSLMCPICLENAASSVLPCGHNFCSLCLSAVHKTSSTCPICRHYFRELPSPCLALQNLAGVRSQPAPTLPEPGAARAAPSDPIYEQVISNALSEAAPAKLLAARPRTVPPLPPPPPLQPVAGPALAAHAAARRVSSILTFSPLAPVISALEAGAEAELYVNPESGQNIDGITSFGINVQSTDELAEVSGIFPLDHWISMPKPSKYLPIEILELLHDLPGLYGIKSLYLVLPLNISNISVFISSLIALSSLNTLAIRRCGLTNDSLHVLTSILCWLPNLEHLSLAKNRLSPPCTPDLCKLAACPRLRTLSLAGNALDTQSCVQVIQNMHPGLRQLSLAHNFAHEAVLDAACEAPAGAEIRLTGCLGRVGAEVEKYVERAKLRDIKIIL